MGSLKSSIVLMRAIDKDKSRHAINAAFDSDIQLVDMLWSYLWHNQCIEENSASKNGWKVTSEGKRWISKYGQVPSG
jgi:hypothetical protein